MHRCPYRWWSKRNRMQCISAIWFLAVSHSSWQNTCFDRASSLVCWFFGKSFSMLDVVILGWKNLNSVWHILVVEVQCLGSEIGAINFFQIKHNFSDRTSWKWELLVYWIVNISRRSIFARNAQIQAFAIRKRLLFEMCGLPSVFGAKIWFNMSKFHEKIVSTRSNRSRKYIWKKWIASPIPDGAP